MCFVSGGLAESPRAPGGHRSIAASAALAAEAGGWRTSTLTGAAWPRCREGRAAPSPRPRLQGTEEALRPPHRVRLMQAKGWSSRAQGVRWGAQG